MKDEIKKAIGAHGMWKTRLKTAITTGRIDVPVETIARDDQCAFGKWLYAPATVASVNGSPHYRTVRDLHAQFHRHAAQVVEHALAGRRTDAERHMDGGYAAASATLTKAMMDWEKSLG